MKRNKMCPLCYIKKLFIRTKGITDVRDFKPYGNGCAETPPMGWSSWNAFKNRIDQTLIYETAVAMKEKGLSEVGYRQINIDDNWHSSMRDENGNLQGDLSTFPDGIPALVKKINALGLKVGMYSSNGTDTCEDLPASLHHEWQDAYTMAKWGVEYFKYDFCHNIPLSKYAPLIYSITLTKNGDSQSYLVKDAKLSGLARYMTSRRVPGGQYVSGLDKNLGAIEFEVNAPADGEYVLSINIFKHGRYEKCLLIQNGGNEYVLEFPPQKIYNATARFQTIVKLTSGKNVLKMFNPIGNRADSAVLQYRRMGEMLKKASKRVAEETGEPEKKIVFSLCEWGRNKPYEWGATAGNLWRTTMDIMAHWWRIKMIYNHNVTLYKYAGKGGWNDPDMLEVGNGSLTYDENVAHFSLWCMMAAPLILGNDLRNMPQNVLDIVTNKNLIAIDQDALGKQAKRVVSGKIDVLVKPLADGNTAICVFNKSKKRKTYILNMQTVYGDEYSCLSRKERYVAVDQWTGATTEVTDKLTVNLNAHGVAVYIVK
jgi:Alpha-galactosidase